MSNSMTLSFTPNDVLFFRDGKNFNQDDEGIAEARTIFPPSPRTVTGAVRATLAKQLGWKSSSTEWPDEIKELLGNREYLNNLNFCGPILSIGHGADGLIFPPPANVTTLKERPIEATMSYPCDQAAFSSDLTKSCNLQPLKFPKDEFAKPLSTYLTKGGMKQVLLGEAPSKSNHFAPSSLTSLETRVGLRRNKSSHTAEEGMLYAATRHRPYHKDLSILCELFDPMLIKHLDNTETKIPLTAPLGGDGTFSHLHRQDFSLREELKSICYLPEAKNGTVQYCLHLLTPAIYSSKDWLIEKSSDYGRIVAIASSKPVSISGWSVGKPRNAYPMWPAGTVFFMEAASENKNLEETLNTLVDNGLKGYGMWAWGFGSVMYGAWPTMDTMEK